MDHHPPPPVAVRNIAVATDFTPWSDRAARHALVVAHQFGAALHLVHALRRSEFPLVSDLMVPLDELAERDGDNMIRRLNVDHSLSDIDHRCWNLNGEFSDTLGSFIRDRKIDLLVLGTRGRSGLAKLLLGSDAQQIFQYVRCPVLTVGPFCRGASRQLRMKNLLFATDLSAESEAAIPYVLTAAKTWGATLDVVHVSSSSPSDSRQALASLRSRLDLLSGSEVPPPRCHLLSGEPSSAVLQFAAQNQDDLIVLGLDHRRSLYEGPSLSHAYEIVRQARCPVLSVRSMPAHL